MPKATSSGEGNVNIDVTPDLQTGLRSERPLPELAVFQCGLISPPSRMEQPVGMSALEPTQLGPGVTPMDLTAVFRHSSWCGSFACTNTQARRPHRHTRRTNTQVTVACSTCLFCSYSIHAHLGCDVQPVCTLCTSGSLLVPCTLHAGQL